MLIDIVTTKSEVFFFMIDNISFCGIVMYVNTYVGPTFNIRTAYIFSCNSDCVRRPTVEWGSRS